MKLTPAKMIEQIALKLNADTAKAGLYVQVQRETGTDATRQIVTEYYPLHDVVTVTAQGNIVLAVIPDGKRVEGQI